MHRRTAVKILLAISIVPLASACRAATPGSRRPARRDLYVCDGCEAVTERSANGLDWATALASPDEPGERLILSGTVYRSDGRTPAAGVVIYAHHANEAGRYAGGGGETIWSRRHGRLRGWIKTGPDGRYEFRTIKPGIYPDRNGPAHIHLFVAEPGRRPYWIDDVVFAGEFGVDERYRRARENRGGAGIVTLNRAPDGTRIARRNVMLEVHPR